MTVCCVVAQQFVPNLIYLQYSLLIECYLRGPRQLGVESVWTGWRVTLSTSDATEVIRVPCLQGWEGEDPWPQSQLFILRPRCGALD